MPDMDGEMLGRKIKSTPSLRDTVLVMLTSLGRRCDAARIKEIGYSAYLTKPVKRSYLFDCLSTVLGDVQTQTRGKGKKKILTRHTIQT